jgi:uncharacterized protein (DUF433 family)
MTKDYRPDPNNPPQLSKSDLARLDRMTDDDIDYSDIAELGDEFFSKARRMTEIDWSNCPDAESIPGKMSGAWCLKGTRIRCQDIITQSYGSTPEEIAGPDIYPELDVALVRRILAFAAKR